MVDETEFKRTYADINQIPCPFEKAILTNCCNCEKSIRILIGSREAGGCTERLAQQQCLEFLNCLHHVATFAVGHTRIDSPLPHGKEVRIQCGGLIGLQQILDKTETVTTKAENVYNLIKGALAKFRKLQNIPFDKLIRSVASYQYRPRRGSNIP